MYSIKDVCDAVVPYLPQKRKRRPQNDDRHFTLPLALLAAHPSMLLYAEMEDGGGGVALQHISTKRHAVDHTLLSKTDAYHLDQMELPPNNTMVWEVVLPPSPCGLTVEVQSLPLSATSLPRMQWWWSRGAAAPPRVALSFAPVAPKEGSEKWKGKKRLLCVEDFLFYKTDGTDTEETIQQKKMWQETFYRSVHSITFTNCIFEMSVFAQLPALLGDAVKELHFHKCTGNFTQDLLRPERTTFPTADVYQWKHVQALFAEECGGEGLWHCLLHFVILPSARVGEAPACTDPLRIFSLHQHKMRQATIDLLLRGISKRNEALYQRQLGQPEQRPLKKDYSLQQLDLSWCDYDKTIQPLREEACWPLWEDLRILTLTQCFMPTEALKETMTHIKNRKMWVFENRWNLKCTDEVIQFLLDNGVTSHSLRYAGVDVSRSKIEEFATIAFP